MTEGENGPKAFICVTSFKLRVGHGTVPLLQKNISSILVFAFCVMRVNIKISIKKVITRSCSKTSFWDKKPEE